MDKKEINRIQAIKNGDIKEFELFFREFFSPLKGYAYKILEDEEDAQEVVQDLFFKIWKKREQFEISSSLSSYLFRAVHNNCLQMIRKRKQKYKYENYLKANGENYTEPIEDLKYNELNERVHHILIQLPERCQTIFKMSRFQGMKYQEIADDLSISIKTVEANMTRALKHFRKNLSDYVVKS